MAEKTKSLQEPTFPAKRKSDLDIQLQPPIKSQKLEEKIAFGNGSTDGKSATKTDLNGVVTVPEEANGGEKGIGAAKIRKIDRKGKGIMLEEENGVPIFRRDGKPILFEEDGIRGGKGKGKGILFEEEDYADYRFSSDDGVSEDSSSSSSSSDDSDFVLSDSDC